MIRCTAAITAKNTSNPKTSVGVGFVLKGVRSGRLTESGSRGSVPGSRRKKWKNKERGRKLVLKKRGKTWHCHFVVNGQRIRQSLETKDWREAQSKEKELIGQAMEGKLTQASTSFARQPFGQ